MDTTGESHPVRTSTECFSLPFFEGQSEGKFHYHLGGIFSVLFWTPIDVITQAMFLRSSGDVVFRSRLLLCYSQSRSCNEAKDNRPGLDKTNALEGRLVSDLQ